MKHLLTVLALVVAVAFTAPVIANATENAAASPEAAMDKSISSEKPAADKAKGKHHKKSADAKSKHHHKKEEKTSQNTAAPAETSKQ